MSGLYAQQNMATNLKSPATDMAQPSSAPSSISHISKARARSRSRPGRRRRDSSPAPSSPPGLPTPTLSPDGYSDGEDELIQEDTLSPFDARRITPTLHASLVSEILSLRREVEHKTKAIDSLELSLDESRSENETLGQNLSQATRDARSLKHQIQLLEGGTSSAMTELARERDDAVENINEVRKKLEQAQKRARSWEEDVERTQMLWDRDREEWENERRNMERKVHVVEGRLKTVLNEVAAAQEARTLRSQTSENDATKEKSKDSDTASVASGSQGRRRTSMTSMMSDEIESPDHARADYHNVRYSVMSLAPGAKNDSGLNLAQELDFEEEDEFAASDEDALPEERPISVHSQSSYTVSSKARKILGLSLQSVGSVTAAEYRALDTAPWSPAKIPEISLEYRDRAVQYSPLPSPELPAVTEENLAAVPVETITEPEREDPEVETPEMKDSATLTSAVEMVSTSIQTVDDLPSSLSIPDIPETGSPAQPAEEAPKPVEMTSISTQTDIPEAASVKEEKASLSPNDILDQRGIPMITIHPPGSEPSSPRNSIVLPPRTKSVSVQANFRPVIEGRSIAIQTEEIRIDRRKLPVSLLPSAIPDLPTQAEARDADYQPYRPPVPPPRSAKREQQRARPSEYPVRSPPALPSEPIQAYPGNNDNGPLSDEVASGIRRPFRSSSLFAGFEQLSDDEGPHGEERDIFTDDELLNRPFAAYKIRRGKLVNAKSRPSLDSMGLPEIDEHTSDSEYRPSDLGGSSSRATQRSGATSSSSRQSGMRKMAMISNGAVTHQKIRSRSPSEPSLDSGSAGSSKAPPFPVPIRHSSRKIPLDGSDGPPSPTRSGRYFSDRGRGSVGRRPTLRRVRSAAAMSNSDLPERPETRSSPARSADSFVPDSPFRAPPMPFDDITAPYERRNAQKRASQRRTPSVNWNHERQNSTGGVQPTSVVDAIAQTMVGEWMFKYVRRRKSSFGMGESKDSWEGKNPDEVSANITNSGVRHKRWVWLAPYEGSIMWSSKQPTSGPALLGKSGRKCKSPSFFYSFEFRPN